jgi:hypothetical protein
MPRLILSKDGTHYFYRQQVFGAGIATFQVHPKGVRVLEEQHIREGDEIPAILLKRLRDLGFAYTGGSGLGEISNNPTSLLNFHFERVELMVKEGSSGWQLCIFLPEIQKRTIQELAPSDYPKCNIVVRDQQVNITKLWPGKAGTLVAVIPDNKPFGFKIAGPWPKHSFPKYPKDLRLDAHCTIFKVSGGIGRRIDKNWGVELGSEYVAITSRPMRTSSAPEKFDDITPAEWRQNGWYCYAFTLPEATQKDLSEWCLKLGFTLREQSWKFSLFSPLPAHYSAEGIPIVTASTIVIEVRRPPSGPKNIKLQLETPSHPAFSIDDLELRLSSEAQSYIEIKLTNAGTFVLRGMNRWVCPLALRFDPDFRSAEHGPKPLTINCRAWSVNGITQSGAQELNIEDANEIEIDAPGLVSVEVDGRFCEFENAEMAESYIRHLAQEIGNLRITDCVIRAGNFGSAVLSLRSNKRTRMGVSADSRSSDVILNLSNPPILAGKSLLRVSGLLGWRNQEMQMSDFTRARALMRKLKRAGTA